ncbi:hypothetical protein BDZ85DRAFT_265770 [Elsinoe ampelina]|uniref:Uncharacterized protein n=1 Tax=Elsinoe ampelina TaxID=302913 RepID=A0A6A6G5E6_9PEZI|nr:hypothetical protein BDZ85DRAFT_265770 [Elsinoe ampelina]
MSEADGLNMSDSKFEPSWSDSDGTAFLPTNLPVKRIARAWERKPSSPYSQKPGVKKVWRRVRMPVFNAPVTSGDYPRSITIPPQDQHVTIESPKKAVKKQCLDTAYGRDWKTTEWDPRGIHMRKKVSRPPIVLRSGARIDPNSDDEGITDEGDDDDQASEAASEGAVGEDADGEWEDVESEDDSEEHRQTGDRELANHNSSAEADKQLIAEQEQLVQASREVVANEDHHTYQQISATEAKEEQHIDSPVSGVPTTSPTKRSPARRSPKKTSPIKHLAEIPTLAIPSPFQRPTSAPPEETITSENWYRPRISDDTAILHAFLSRAAANKKPLAKRESLTNRRDSGAIRHALASPAKPDVLTELDANSPSPHKSARVEIEEKGKAASDEKSPSSRKAEELTEETKPKRRSGRSRARPALLLDQMTADEPVKGPNKITIRGPTEQVNLKKNEVAELAAQTRSNTRKNKGQSIMPIARLSKLADEAVEVLSEDMESKPNQEGRNVHWDETLAYFSKSPEQSLEADPEAGEVPDTVQETSGKEAAATSPPKSRSKRAKVASPKKAAPEPDQEPVVSTPAPKPAPSKRRSRIATPAKGLLSKSLLPEDVVPHTNEPEPTKPAPTTAPVSRKRALPTPKRSAHAVVSALKQCATDSAPTAAPAQPGLGSRPPLSPRKAAPTTASSIPSLGTFAPRMNSEIPKLNFDEAVGTNFKAKNKTSQSGAEEEQVPGLASPAKRRRGVLGLRRQVRETKEEREETLPGLMSPAKKRTRSAL